MYVTLLFNHFINHSLSITHPQAIRQSGVKHVFVASACPAIRYCNIYGIDMPTRKELIAYGKTEEEVANQINAEFVLYQTLEDLKQACKDAALCNGKREG